MALLDTNVLIYADQHKNKYHQAAYSLRERGTRGEILLCISPQILTEFFTFMTRTDGRGLENPLSSEDAATEVQKYLDAEHIHMIYPIAATWPLMINSLLKQRPVTGLAIHDIHLAATMLSNGVNKIYTFNARDFKFFSELEVINPADIKLPKKENQAFPKESESTEQK